MGAAPSTVTVGHVPIPMDTAMGWVLDYTDAARNEVATSPYAFPAYDRFDGGSNRPDRLTDADLLAPTLLNVPVKIRSFYALQRARPALELALANRLLA